MVINLNELKQYDTISLNIGNGLIIDLKMSNDKQSVDISLNKSNETLCSSKNDAKTEDNNIKQIGTKDLLSNKEYPNFIKNKDKINEIIHHIEPDLKNKKWEKIMKDIDITNKELELRDLYSKNAKLMDAYARKYLFVNFLDSIPSLLAASDKDYIYFTDEIKEYIDKSQEGEVNNEPKTENN